MLLEVIFSQPTHMLDFRLGLVITLLILLHFNKSMLQKFLSQILLLNHDTKNMLYALGQMAVCSIL